MNAHGIPISVNGKVVGEVRDDGVFQKHILSSRHFLQRPTRSIAFDEQTLAAAERAGADQVEIFDDETNEVYRASIALIRERGFQVERGFGSQIALALRFFNAPEQPAVVQPTLFEIGGGVQ